MQGKGDIASFWAMVSIVHFFAHALFYKELDLPGVDGGLGFKKTTMLIQMMLIPGLDQ